LPFEVELLRNHGFRGYRPVSGGLDTTDKLNILVYTFGQEMKHSQIVYFVVPCDTCIMQHIGHML
jgi:hypothetical protein